MFGNLHYLVSSDVLKMVFVKFYHRNINYMLAIKIFQMPLHLEQKT